MVISDSRIYGVLAYGDDKKITSALERIHAYRYEDYSFIDIWVDIEYAVKEMDKLKDKRKSIVNLLLQGLPPSYVATEESVSERYIWKIRQELYEVLRGYFCKTISKEEYRKYKHRQVRYRNELRSKIGAAKGKPIERINDSRSSDTNEDYEGNGKDPVDNGAYCKDLVMDIAEEDLDELGFYIVIDEDYTNPDYEAVYSINERFLNTDEPTEFMKENVEYDNFIEYGGKPRITGSKNAVLKQKNRKLLSR